MDFRRKTIRLRKREVILIFNESLSVDEIYSMIHSFEENELENVAKSVISQAEEQYGLVCTNLRKIERYINPRREVEDVDLVGDLKYRFVYELSNEGLSQRVFFNVLDGGSIKNVVRFKIK